MPSVEFLTYTRHGSRKYTASKRVQFVPGIIHFLSLHCVGGDLSFHFSNDRGVGISHEPGSPSGRAIAVGYGAPKNATLAGVSTGWVAVWNLAREHVRDNKPDLELQMAAPVGKIVVVGCCRL